MDDVVGLMKATVAELEKLLSAKNVLGEPIDRENATVIPLVSYGFGFGAGGGTEGAARPSGTGSAAGGGIRPVGAIILDDNGARVEPVRSNAATLAEALGATVSRVLKARKGGDTPAASTREADPKSPEA